MVSLFSCLYGLFPNDFERTLLARDKVDMVVWCFKSSRCTVAGGSMPVVWPVHITASDQRSLNARIALMV